MSFIMNKKIELPNEDKTKLKFLSIAYNIGCYKDVKKLFDKYDSLNAKYANNAYARVQIVENMIIELYNIDVRLVGWLIDENGKVMVNGKVIFELKDDSQMKGIY